MPFIGLNQCRKCGKALDRNHPTSWCEECIEKEAERMRKTLSEKPEMDYELKPCPFCGCDILIKCHAKLTKPWWDVHWIHEGMEDRRTALQRGEHVDYCVIESVHMMVSGENEDSVRQEAIRLWNRRVKE